MVEKGKLSKDNYIWMLDAAGGHYPLKMLSHFFHFPETAVNRYQTKLCEISGSHGGEYEDDDIPCSLI
jgi:hypothetical protein